MRFSTSSSTASETLIAGKKVIEIEERCCAVNLESINTVFTGLVAGFTVYCDFNFGVFGTIQTTVLIVIASLEREYHSGVSEFSSLAVQILVLHCCSFQFEFGASWN
ncbi:hypothetical protein VNO80_03355 [Phaseolus coccineus]|uniref:Uncharacterized protein n=1 Tax=Phaseolus coccineus TaxID=3886 RepID=A0AAN9NT03_PHACN